MDYYDRSGRPHKTTHGEGVRTLGGCKSQIYYRTIADVQAAIVSRNIASVVGLALWKASPASRFAPRHCCGGLSAQKVPGRVSGSNCLIGDDVERFDEQSSPAPSFFPWWATFKQGEPESPSQAPPTCPWQACIRLGRRSLSGYDRSAIEHPGRSSIGQSGRGRRYAATATFFEYAGRDQSIGR